MAWPFGRKDRKEVEDDLTDERLRMMANVAIEQVPLPEEGIMTEEDAWTISPGPARVAMGGDSGPAPQYAAPAPAAVRNGFFLSVLPICPTFLDIPLL